MTAQQEQVLDALRATSDSALTTRQITRLRIYVNGSATIKAVRRLEHRGLVTRVAHTPVTGGIIWALAYYATGASLLA